MQISDLQQVCPELTAEEAEKALTLCNGRWGFAIPLSNSALGAELHFATHIEACNYATDLLVALHPGCASAWPDFVATGIAEL